MKCKHKNFMRCIISFALTVVMVMGEIPLPFISGSTFVYAATETYTDLIPIDSDDDETLENKKVTFNDIQWFIIADNSTNETAVSGTFKVGK